MSEINEDDIFNQNGDPTPTTENYTDDSIVHLEDMEHIRRRPGMYIGKLGDGASQDDGIYVLIKEVIDNSIDEFTSGYKDICLSRRDACINESSCILRRRFLSGPSQTNRQDQAAPQVCNRVIRHNGA